MISMKSQVLQGLVGCQREVYLDQFGGEVEGVKDAVELLYGGDVHITQGNVKTVLKFSVVYEIKDLYELVLEWVTGNMNSLNLYEMIEFGVMIERLGKGKDDILKICIKFICENVKEDLNEFHFQKENRHSVNCVKFLIQEEILIFTLPILTSWISNDSDIIVVIAELERKGLDEYLGGYEGSLALLDKMVEKMERAETSTKAMQLQRMWSNNKKRKIVQNPIVPKKTLATLLKENYRSFTVQQIIDLEEHYQLEHFEFVEILVAWKLRNGTTQQNMDKVWDKVRPLDLIKGFLCSVINSISVVDGVTPSKVVDPVSGSKYKYDGIACISVNYQTIYNHYTDLLKPIDVRWTCKNDGCAYSRCSLRVKVRIHESTDKSPCYDIGSITMNEDPGEIIHHSVDHAYLVKTKKDPFSYKVSYHHYSLLTNSYSAVLNKIRTQGSYDPYLGIRLMYKCHNLKPCKSSRPASNSVPGVSAKRPNTQN